MGAEVFRAEGTLGRFDEDGLLVYFNDPLPCAEPAAQAVRMVLAMRDRAASMMSGWRRNGHELAFIAGVTLGYATLGEIGCDGRLDYGPVGPIVKLAFRLADEAKPGQILTTGRVQAVVKSDSPVRALWASWRCAGIRPTCAGV